MILMKQIPRKYSVLLVYALWSDMLPPWHTLRPNVTVPSCCGPHELCYKVFCLWFIYPPKLFSCPLGGYGVMVCMYLWARVAALSPVIVLFRSHMAASQHPTPSSISLRALPCLTVALLHNVQLWCGVVGDICSSPPAKSPHHMVLFTRSLFHIPAMWRKKKKALKHTNSIQMTTEEIQLQETHSPPTLPWAHSGLCCMRTRTGRWACCGFGLINDYSEALEISSNLSSTLLSSHCPSQTCLVGVCEQYLESPRSKLGSTDTFWSSVRRRKLSHVWSSMAGNSLASSWLAASLVCGSVIGGWPQTCSGRPEAVIEPPSVFWLSQADCCTLTGCWASASSPGMQHPCKVPQSCEGSQWVSHFICDVC